MLIRLSSALMGIDVISCFSLSVSVHLEIPKYLPLITLKDFKYQPEIWGDTQYYEADYW